jgi:hypothetical protein
VDLAAVHAGSVDAGLREFILAVLVALVDEDLVVDPAGDDIQDMLDACRSGAAT